MTAIFSSDFLPANAPYTEGVERLQAHFSGSETVSAGIVIVIETTGNIREEPGWSCHLMP